MAESRGPAKIVTVGGESWELVKSATDSAVDFPYKRVDVKDYHVASLDNYNHMLILTAYLRPTPQSLETPQRLAFIGFANQPLTAIQLTPHDLRRMHIYKADLKNFADEFAKSFLDQGQKQGGMTEIKPFPDLMTGEKDNGSEEQSDDA